MTQPDIIDRVNKILIDEFELEQGDLTPEATLYDQLGLDSLDIVDLAVALEKEFGLKVKRTEDEERIRAIRALSDVYAFVEFKLEESHPRE